MCFIVLFKISKHKKYKYSNFFFDFQITVDSVHNFGFMRFALKPSEISDWSG